MGKTIFDFSNQVVVITGAAMGIGKRSAERFAESGAKVFLIDIDKKGGASAAQEIQGRGGDATFVECDLTDAASVKRAFDTVVNKAGRIDILVNSAGGFHMQLAITDTPEEEWDAVIDRNLKSVFLTAKAVIPVFQKQQSGRIINLGSMAGLTTFNLSSPPYSAAKAGVHCLTRVLAYELGKYGVTVNAIAPGTTATERVIAVRSEEQRKMIGKSTLVGRIAEVEDMVGWVLFLAAPESSYLTGQTIAVNGGRLMV
jgi:NAD(P)-dependent dehydrogenase (short-subunit alcohol dehydrogenase family)